jgi:uncharacterized protein YgbK (DUF1537 family)
MFAVIADDFTGAAEIAGICLRYNLKTIVSAVGTDLSNNDADVIVINTDSRSKNKEAAIEVTMLAIKQLLLLKPGWIYKKTDSVLRGYVVDELKVQMALTGFKKVLFVPANPSLGRTIKNGHYFIGDKKIHDTGFANDPEFPVTSSSVTDMLGDGAVKAKRHSEDLDEAGIVIGEAEGNEDVVEWVERTDDNHMLAGAGDFFTAILDRKFKAVAKEEILPQLPHLYVCGTAFNKSKELIKKIDEQLHCVMYLPEIIYDGDAVADEWLESLKAILSDQKRVIVAIEKNETTRVIAALDMRRQMAVIVKMIIEKTAVKEIFIEGGSTAAAILEVLNIHTLIAHYELERGVVCMKANELSITVKPGSYELPHQIRRVYS